MLLINAHFCLGLPCLQVLVMSSLRKPKRLTIRGGDSRDYRFLVKGSEDLRMDQRIEQVCECLKKPLI